MRVVPAGISSRGAIHLGVISAATVIGSTWTLNSKPAELAKSTTVERSACSANRPVTNRIFSDKIVSFRGGNCRFPNSMILRVDHQLNWLLSGRRSVG